MHRTGSGRTEASSGATDERRAGASTSSSGGSSSSAPAEALAREVTDRQYVHDIVPELADRRAETERDWEDPPRDDDEPAPAGAGAVVPLTTSSSGNSRSGLGAGSLLSRVDAVPQRPGASAYECQVGGPCCNDTLSGAAPAGGLSAFGVL
jgi:hypothetical protein